MGIRCRDKTNAYKDYPMPSLRNKRTKTSKDRDRVHKSIDIKNIC